MTIGVGGFGTRNATKNNNDNLDGKINEKDNSVATSGVGSAASSIYRLGQHINKPNNSNGNNEREIPSFSNISRRFPTNGPKRSITVIDEASV